MKALQVRYDTQSGAIGPIENAVVQDWQQVCRQYDDDVHRLCGHDDQPPYSAVYVCFDDANQPAYFLVEEDLRLYRLRHRVFHSKVGKKT